jgi:hypothetical protein
VESPPCATEIRSTALHCTALYCTALHCIALHCIALYREAKKTAEKTTADFDIWMPFYCCALLPDAFLQNSNFLLHFSQNKNGYDSFGK